MGITNHQNDLRWIVLSESSGVHETIKSDYNSVDRYQSNYSVVGYIVSQKIEYQTIEVEELNPVELLEIQAWLELAESSFDFWDNDDDAFFDDL